MTRRERRGTSSAGPWLPGAPAPGPSRGEAPVHVNAAQRAAVDMLYRSVAAVGPPPLDLDRQGALRELLSKHSYSGDSCAVAPYDSESIAYPPEGTFPIRLGEAAGDAGNRVAKVLCESVLPSSETRENLEALGLKKPYSDPLFTRKPSEYRKFVQ